MVFRRHGAPPSHWPRAAGHRDILRATEWVDVVPSHPHYASGGAPLHLTNVERAYELLASNKTLVSAHLDSQRPPVSPALRCLAVLTVLFFGVYLLMVCLRFCRMQIKALRSRLQSAEAWLGTATEALALVPMLCILMISARVRAMQLGCMQGDPPPWAQISMYVATASFMLYLMVHATLPPSSMKTARTVWRVVRSIVSLGMYGGCAVIFCSVLVMSCERPTGTPDHTPMMLCVTLLTVFYFTQYLGLELFGVIRELCNSPEQTQRAGSAGTTLSPPSSSSSPQGPVMRDFLANLRVMRVLDVADAQQLAQEGGDRRADGSKPLGLQFTPMLCVLLVSITLRQMQLKVEPTAWACAAMFLTTAAIIVQAIIAAVIQYLIFGDLCELAPADEAAGKGGQQVRGTPTVENAFDFECCKRNSSSSVKPCDAIMMNSWWIVVISFHMGIFAIVVSVFQMEEEPLDAVFPLGDDITTSSAQDLLNRPSKFVPVSTPMRCAMMLSMLYFGTFFFLMVLRTASTCIGKWVSAIMDGVQRSLAFAPMLCVMMIGVRLRAMQLRTQPQAWAGVAMYMASFAVIGQVVTAHFFVTHRDNPRQPQVVFPGFARMNEDSDHGSIAIHWKILAIILLVLHYAARFCLYAALAVLITALFTMEPSGPPHL